MSTTNKKNLNGLYVLTSADLISETALLTSVEQTLQGGARIIQYRDKSNHVDKRLQQATALKKLCSHYQALLIINDDVELAQRSNADGVHLGKADASLADARARLANKIIGVSCYNQFELALTAAAGGADYIAFGSFFSSATKPEAAHADTALLTQAKKELQLPVCAVGGITADNAANLIQAGADMVAVITDIWTAADISARSQQYAALF